jgi:hypothetical protein
VRVRRLVNLEPLAEAGPGAFTRWFAHRMILMLNVPGLQHSEPMPPIVTVIVKSRTSMVSDETVTGVALPVLLAPHVTPRVNVIVPLPLSVHASAHWPANPIEQSFIGIADVVPSQLPGELDLNFIV